jgi:2-polyprenyl-6-hydroxyphenyl methylase/3-demethylubiquinone-9 3-methyltransferase
MFFATPNWGLLSMTWSTSPSDAEERRPMLRKDVSKSFPATLGTADPVQIARFNALADEWWKSEGAFKVVHAFNRARVAHLRQRLPILLQRDPTAPQPLSGLDIIDVGCGAGLVTEPISSLGASVLGIDAAERNVLVAERHARLTGACVRYRHALPEDIAAEGGRFDAVISLEVVEHVADLQTFIAALARLVKPGGVLVIGTLNRTIRSFIKAIIGAEYVLGWLPRGTHDWRKFVTPDELDRGLRPYDFMPVERTGVVLNPLSMQWSISPDDSATYLQFHRKTLQGSAGPGSP